MEVFRNGRFDGRVDAAARFLEMAQRKRLPCAGRSGMVLQRGSDAGRQSLRLAAAAGEKHGLRVLRYNRRKTCWWATALKRAKGERG
jgi:hypothetical protein